MLVLVVTKVINIMSNALCTFSIAIKSDHAACGRQWSTCEVRLMPFTCIPRTCLGLEQCPEVQSLYHL